MMALSFTAHIAESPVCIARAPFRALRIAISPILTKFRRFIASLAWRFRHWRQFPGAHVLTSDAIFNSARPVTV